MKIPQNINVRERHLPALWNLQRETQGIIPPYTVTVHLPLKGY